MGNEKDAVALARQIASKTATGEVASLALTPADRYLYFRVLEILKPTGETLEVAVSTYAKAKAKLGARSLEAAVDDYLALGAFAGLRAAEIERQQWEDINLKRGWIRVTAAKGNTAQSGWFPFPRISERLPNRSSQQEGGKGLGKQCLSQSHTLLTDAQRCLLIL